MIAYMFGNKKLYPIIELLIRGRIQNISLAFISQYYFAVPKNIDYILLFYYEDFKQKKTSTNCV